MRPVPPHLLQGFADIERADIEAWWRSLTNETRAQITQLCDERHEACLFGILGTEDAPEIETGHFLPGAEDPQQSLQGEGAWNQDQFDYLMNHPELVVVWDPETRSLHIGCVAHFKARQCWQNMAVPADFSCPFHRGDTCLMVPFRGRKIHPVR